jgi:misacylated tRNA(Ala) deacylase
MTKLKFIDDAYIRDADARVFTITDEGGIILDASIFYATDGGQPGDSGTLTWQGGGIDIATAVKGAGGTIILIPSEPNPLPAVGVTVKQSLNWERRHRHMRVHTALHLLSAVILQPVIGGSISSEKGRLDFDMPDAIANKAVLENSVNNLINCNLDISTEWIDESELAPNIKMLKTMLVAPPKVARRIRIVRIGAGENIADYQPCGGTHVRNTSEIGRVSLVKVEKKGKQNRRVYLHLST